MNTKILNEKEFHDNRFTKDVRQEAWKFYSIERGSRRYFENLLLQHVSNKKILELGCGKNTYLFKIIGQAEKGVGIDISEVAIIYSKKKMKELNINDKAEFYIMNAEEIIPQKYPFDLIIGSGIIHHLDIEKFVDSSKKVLSKNGSIILIEPLGYNIFINLYRKLTPSYRTRDEHPLKIKDLRILKENFLIHKFKYFHLFTLLGVPFRNYRVFSLLLRTLEFFDEIILKIPLVKLLSWQVVIYLEKPVTDHNK